MKKKYAAAIRFGIEQGKRHRFGEENDPFFEAWRAVVNYAFGESHRLNDLAIKAFERTTQKVRSEWAKQMTHGQTYDVLAVFDRVRVLHTESREEREMRLLREEVAAMREQVKRWEEATK